MKTYGHDTPGLLIFYGDRIAAWKRVIRLLNEPPIGLDEFVRLLALQGQFHENVHDWALRVLAEPCPSGLEDPKGTALWLSCYRLVRRGAYSIGHLHPQYWDGWHPDADPDEVREREEQGYEAL